MKRAADTHHAGVTGTAGKKRRTDQENFLGAEDDFAEELEVKSSALSLSPQLDETRYIAGQVFMLWPISNKTRKLQLKINTDSLDVVFGGAGLEKLDFTSKDRLKLSLQGGKKEAKKAGSPHTLPFKLVFPNGALVKFLKSEKRLEDKVVNLFKDARDEMRRAEEDWFYPPSKASASLVAYPDDKVVPSEPDDSVIDSGNHAEIIREVSEADPLNNSIRGTEDRDPAVHHIHRIGETRSEVVIRSDAKSPTLLVPTMRSSSHTSISPPDPKTSVTHAPQKKQKRIKKRDTRHGRLSLGSSTPDLVSVTDISDPNGQKPRGKKAAKRRGAQTKHRPSSPPPPYRDPALDLVPGFSSERGGVYTPLGHITPGSRFCFVGIVVDTGPVKHTKTGDLSKSYRLVDPSMNGHQSLTVNIFASHKEENILPSTNPNQVLLLRNVKCTEFNGKMQGTGYKDSFQWCGYDPTEGKHFYTSLQSNDGTFFSPSAAEMEYFVRIADWWRALNEAAEKERMAAMNDPSADSTSHISLPTQSLRKTQTISQLEPGIFVDCVVQLLRVWKHDISSDIYVTDYSENKNLPHNADVDASLLGRRILKISLWDGPNTMVDDLELHGFYLLRNLRIKKLEGSRTFLEGHLGYTDRGIYKLGPGSDQPNLQELLSRKKNYERNPQYSKFESAETVDNVGEPMQQGHDVSSSISVGTVTENPVVECLHMEQKLSTIAEIRQNNQCPNKFRIRGRILDYYPRRIEDFVTVECNDCHKFLDAGHNLCPECGDLAGKAISVRYQFALRIMDESGEELNVNVCDNDADGFLSGLDPRDAREDASALKRRLEPLLGHLRIWHNEFLEETKAIGPLLDLCLNCWMLNTGDGQSNRLYQLFGCKLQQKNCD